MNPTAALLNIDEILLYCVIPDDGYRYTTQDMSEYTLSLWTQTYLYGPKWERTIDANGYNVRQFMEDG